MSGDLGPRVAILAAKKFLWSNPNSHLTLVGDDAILHPLIKQHLSFCSNISIRHSPHVVEMGDDPFFALRHKQDSSMWLSLSLLQKGEVGAVVSAGNTGALLLMAQHLVKRCDHVERIALGKFLPTANGELTYLLDMGAAIQCNVDHLHQFAQMAMVMLKVAGVTNPRIYLLNIGVEEVKGTELIQAAHKVFALDDGLNYQGFIESNELLSGKANIIVCDGFAGNVALKASEGAASYIYDRAKKLGRSSATKKMMAMLAAPFLKALANDISPAQYNGALLLGLKKPVIKSHGAADVDAFYHAICTAYRHTISNVAEMIEQHLAVK